MMMRMDLDDFGQSVHDIATNYIDTDLEVSGSSFKETAIEAKEQTKIVFKEHLLRSSSVAACHTWRESRIFFKKNVS